MHGGLWLARATLNERTTETSQHFPLSRRIKLGPEMLKVVHLG